MMAGSVVQCSHHTDRGTAGTDNCNSSKYLTISVSQYSQALLSHGWILQLIRKGRRNLGKVEIAGQQSSL